MSVTLPYCFPDEPIVIRYADNAFVNMPVSYLENPSCGGYVDEFGIDWGQPFRDPNKFQQQGGAICMWRTEKTQYVLNFHYGMIPPVNVYVDELTCPHPSGVYWRPIGGIGQYGTSTFYRWPLGVTWVNAMCPVHQEIESARKTHYVKLTLFYLIPAFPSLIPLLAVFLFPCFAFLSMGGFVLSNALSASAGRRRQRRRRIEEDVR